MAKRMKLFVFNPYGVGVSRYLSPRVSPAAIHVQPLQGYERKKLTIRKIRKKLKQKETLFLVEPEGPYHSNAKKNAKKMEDAETLAKMIEWLSQWWESADEKHKNWLEIQMKHCFPEYVAWLAEKEKIVEEKNKD